MDNNEILDLMHLGGVTLKRPELLVNADQLQIRKDLQAQLPNFVFVYEQELAKEYLFNFYAYLQYVGCHVYWESQLDNKEVLNRAVFLVPASLMKAPQLEKYKECRFVPLYPGPRGKQAIATQIFGLIGGLQKIGHLEEPSQAQIWLDQPEGQDKWLFNLAGFLAYLGILVGWGQPPKHLGENTLFVGHEKPETGMFIALSSGEPQACKMAVFNELLVQGYLQKSASSFVPGPKFTHLNEEVPSLVKETESKASDEAVANDEVQSGNDDSKEEKVEEKVEEKTAENQ